MKGFLIGFLIFLVWAFGCIYYLHLKNDSNTKTVSQKSTDVIKNQDANSLSENDNERIAIVALEDSLANSSKDVNNNVILDTEPSTIADSLIVSIDEIQEKDPAFLIDEIKKSIVINDSLSGTENATLISSRIFYPEYDRTDLILNKALIDYAGELKEFLKENPEKKVTIIGHTDNIGNAQDNFQSGLRKSRQIKWYFTTRRGIPRSKVTATSRGETEAIATNSNASGRKKNNRIEIIID